MNETKFASQGDLEVKQVSFSKLSDHAYAYTAEGDPNSGIVIGDDGVMVIDTQATPAMAQDVIDRVREVTDNQKRLAGAYVQTMFEKVGRTDRCVLQRSSVHDGNLS